MKVAVTGGTGFIAQGVLEAFRGTGIAVRAISRQRRQDGIDRAQEWATIPAYDDLPALSHALRDIDCLIHLAANPNRRVRQSGQEARRVSATIVQALRNARVRRVVVASSVYARLAPAGNPESYGEAKRETEAEFLSADGLQVAVLRLPPVYGLGGRGGLATIAGLVSKGVPLPLALARQPRAYLSRRNLNSLLVAMVTATQDQWVAAAGRIFEPSDGLDISTRDLVVALAEHMGVPARLLPVPAGALHLMARATGMSAFVASAFDALPVAPVEDLEAVFGWRPIERIPQSLSYIEKPH